MSWKNKLKKLGINLAILVGLNQIAFPLMTPISNNLFPKNNISLEKVKKDKYPFKQDMSRVEFLCMASSLVHKAKSQQETWRNSVCEDYARATLDMYNYLVKKAGREDISDKVNLAFGEITTPKGKLIGHAWIEVENNEIKLFESTNFTIYFHNSNNYQYGVDFSCHENSKHFKPEWKLNYNWSKSTPSGFVYPTIESLTLPGGAMRLLYILVSSGEEYIDSYLD